MSYGSPLIYFIKKPLLVTYGCRSNPHDTLESKSKNLAKIKTVEWYLSRKERTSGFDPHPCLPSYQTHQMQSCHMLPKIPLSPTIHGSNYQCSLGPGSILPTCRMHTIGGKHGVAEGRDNQFPIDLEKQGSRGPTRGPKLWNDMKSSHTSWRTVFGWFAERGTKKLRGILMM